MSDQRAREEAVANFSQTLLVEAGAGTGKTTLLVNRICSLIEKGVEAEKIAAVTFTVKAAGELKERLRKKLKQTDSANARRALQQLDCMTVNTIHGLAAELLRTLPIEAHLPPEFIALDDLQQTAAVTEFRTNWLMRALDIDVPKTLELADALGLDLLGSEKKGLAKLFDILSRSMANLDEVTTGEATSGDVEELLTELRRQVSVLAQQATGCINSSDILYALVKAIISWIGKTPNNVVSPEGIAWLQSIRISKDKGNKKNWTSNDILEQIRASRDDIALYVDTLKQIVSSIICNDIVKWLSPAVTDFRKHLRDSGTIGFDDLLILCRDMLRDSKVARDYFKSRYDYVHIDEFQDTDPIQVEILFYLCEARKSHGNKWHELELEPGKLFVVGDPKQSIYRFRGADVRIYNRVARMIEEKGKKLAITRNFRSRPTILSEVNAVFELVMQGGSDDEAQYVALEPAEDAVTDPMAVELLLPPISYNYAAQNAAQSAAHEAAAIANHIALQREVNTKFCYSDVAILMRTGTKVVQLQEALSAQGIPFISFMNSAFTSRVEIESLITILTAVANPQHTVATIGTLRSPWFSLSDDDIFGHKLAGRGFVYTDAQSADDPVCAALRELNKWHTLSKQIEPSTLIEELLAAFPIDIIYGLKSEGVLRVQNIQTLIELVRRLEQGGVKSLSAIVDRISDMQRLVQSTELEARDDSMKAVQLLTLHKSKGLEFKCVYLYNYNEKVRSHGEWLLHKSLDNEPHQLGISGSDGFRTRNWDAVDAANKSAEGAELQRLLYVGMTRAKDKLVLPLGWSRSGKQPSIPVALKERYSLDEHSRPTLKDTKAIATIVSDVAKSDFNPLAIEKSVESRNTASDIAKHKAWKDALAARLKTLEVVVPPDDEDEIEVDWNRVRARKIGTFVHAVLEQSAKGKSIADGKQLAARGISLSVDEEVEAETIINQVLQSKLFTEELPASRRIITELPIVEDHENYVAAKFVDLMFETQAGEWVLVDYKTDDIPIEAVNDRKEHHRKQLAQYGQMFAQIMGKPPQESRVYFLRPNRMVNL